VTFALFLAAIHQSQTGMTQVIILYYAQFYRNNSVNLMQVRVGSAFMGNLAALRNLKIWPIYADFGHIDEDRFYLVPPAIAVQ
jgi:hypothetical protein